MFFLAYGVVVGFYVLEDHEAETPGFARLEILVDVGLLHRAKAREVLLKQVVFQIPWQTSHENFPSSLLVILHFCVVLVQRNLAFNLHPFDVVVFRQDAVLLPLVLDHHEAESTRAIRARIKHRGRVYHFTEIAKIVLDVG